MALTKVKGPVWRYTDNFAGIDVQDYGAKIDGATDDTVAVQAAFNAVPVTGGIVYFPAGTCVLSNIITHTDTPIQILGDGVGISILSWTGANGAGISITQDTPSYFTEIGGLTMLIDKDAVDTAFTLNLTGQASGGTLLQARIQRAYVHDLQIRGAADDLTTDAWDWGIEFVDVMNATIERVYVQGKYTTNEYTADPSGGIHISGANGVKELQIKDCWIYNVTDGILVEQAHGTKIDSVNMRAVTRGIKVLNATVEKWLSIINAEIAAFEHSIHVTKVARLQIDNCYLHARTDGNTAAVNFVHIFMDDCEKSSIRNIHLDTAGVAYLTEIGIDLATTTDETEIRDVRFNDMITGVRIGASVTDTKIHSPTTDTVTTQYSDSGTDTVFFEDAQTKYKVADETRTVDTFVDDTHLLGWTLTEGSSYKVTGFFAVNSATSSTPDIRIRFQTDNSFVGSGWQLSRVSVAGLTEFDTAVSITAEQQISLLANDASSIFISGYVRTHATLPCAVDFQWGQLTTDAVGTTVEDGSWISFERIA